MIRKLLIVVCLLAGCLGAFAREVQTEMPIVKLEFDYDKLDKDTFCAAVFTLIEGEKTVTMPAAVRHRGAYSLRYEKQSYAVKLYDELGEKKDTALLGMREDNYWILDAMAADCARMRNRVGMDIWLEYSAKPYYAASEPEMKNGVDGLFVEAYVNDDYRGIYCLSERVDRKQLKLKKNKNDKIQGLLYKSVGWAGSFFERPLYPYDDEQETWKRFEFKYPDPEDSLFSWKPLYDAIHLAAYADDETFVNHIADSIDIPVFMDYEIFTDLMSAADNRGKNLYLSIYNIQKPENSKFVITPWDMDHSFGRNYKAWLIEPDDWEEWDNTLYKRLKELYPDYAEQRKARYAYWRENAFNTEALAERFGAYFNLFRETGAAERETERWDGIHSVTVDWDAEEQYIASWNAEHLAYVDEMYEYEPPTPTTVERISANPTSPRKVLDNGTLLIVQPDGTRYNVMGQKQ